MNILTDEAKIVLLKERFPFAKNPMIHLEMLVLAAKLKKAGIIKPKK